MHGLYALDIEGKVWKYNEKDAIMMLEALYKYRISYIYALYIIRHGITE